MARLSLLLALFVASAAVAAPLHSRASSSSSYKSNYSVQVSNNNNNGNSSSNNNNGGNNNNSSSSSSSSSNSSSSNSIVNNNNNTSSSSSNDSNNSQSANGDQECNNNRLALIATLTTAGELINVIPTDDGSTKQGVLGAQAGVAIAGNGIEDILTGLITGQFPPPSGQTSVNLGLTFAKTQLSGINNSQVNDSVSAAQQAVDAAIGNANLVAKNCP